MEELRVDVAVVGGGSGGLSVAAGAVQMGSSVVLFERAEMGGDCLNHGCVPSKATIAAAHAAQTFRGAGAFGVAAAEPAVSAGAVREHVRGVISAIAPNDSVERFEGLGVRVIRAEARFAGKRVLEGGGCRVRAKWIVLATGSSPAVPPIPGIDTVGFLTNETVFDLDETPRHLIIVGGGPIGIELAQAHRRLGAKVTVLEMFSILPKDDPDAVAVIRRQLAREGVDLREGIRVAGVARSDAGIDVAVEENGKGTNIPGSHLLIAAGRMPNLKGLDLEAGGIAHDRRGVTVDARLRSSDRRVFAIGDIAGGFQFTHMASHHAGIVIRNALFRLPARAETRAVPWVTYTDPELAHVGLSEPDARRTLGDKVRIAMWPFAENDRAQAERATEGFVKAVVGPRGRVLGATIVGKRAGELIQPWVLAVARNLRIGAMAAVIAPYPTLGEASKRAAGSYFTEALFGTGTKRLVRTLLRFA